MDQAEGWVLLDHRSSLWLSAHFSNFFSHFGLLFALFPGKASFSFNFFMWFLSLMKTLDVHHTTAFCGVKLPAHHRCVYIYHLWKHKPLSTVVIIKYQNKICLHGKKITYGTIIYSEQRKSNQLGSAHFINCTNGYFKFLAVWWIKVRSLPCQKVPSDRVTSKTEGKGEKQTCGYRMSWSVWEF